MDPDITDADYDKLWEKIDTDKSGDLSVKELATYFGYSIDGKGSVEMTDEQILQALMMGAELEEQAPVKKESKEVEKNTGKAPPKDDTLKKVALEKKKKDPTPEEERMILFLENITMGSLKIRKDEDSVQQLIDECLGEGSCEGQTKKPFTVRCQDEKEEMALHKLARLNVVKEEAGPGQHLESTFKGIVLKIIKISRDEVCVRPLGCLSVRERCVHACLWTPSTNHHPFPSLLS